MIGVPCCLVSMWVCSCLASELAGSALSFDGVDDYVNCGTSPNYSIHDEITLEAWVNGQFANGSVVQTIARRGDRYYLAVCGRNPYSRIWTTQWKIARSECNLRDNVWYHIAMTYDRNRGGMETDSLTEFDTLREDNPGLPIVPEGNSTDWDQHIREIGNILYEPNDPDPNKVWKLWYSGWNGLSYVQNLVYIGYAYSADGKNWKKSGKIFTRAGEDPYVVHHNGVYYLYCEDKEDVPFRNIRLYTSTDCETWTDRGDVLDVQGGGNPSGWQSQDVSSPTVWVEDNGIWHMLYEGRGGGYGGLIGLAYSGDGIQWVRDTNDPVMAGGHAGSWDESNVVPDDIIKIDRTYYLLYHAYSIPRGVGFWEGLALSEDLHNWSRYELNPIATETDTIMYFHDGDNGMLYHARGGIRKFHPYIASSPRLYVNGVQYGYTYRDECGNAAIQSDSVNFTIGSAPLGVYPFRGMIDNVRLWDRAMSEEEIRENRNRFVEVNEPNLVAYWDFNENSGRVAHTLSISGDDAYLGLYPDSDSNSEPKWVVPIIDWEGHNACDFDKNSAVDANDLQVIAGNWLNEVMPSTPGELVHDGIINFNDFAAFATQWLWRAQ